MGENVVAADALKVGDGTGVGVLLSGSILFMRCNMIFAHYLVGQCFNKAASGAGVLQ